MLPFINNVFTVTFYMTQQISGK